MTTAVTPPPRQTPTAQRLDTLAAEINHHHNAACAAIGTALDHAMAAGGGLNEAKSLVQHGQWIPWLDENFPGSERSAQAYMRLAKRRPEIEAARKSAESADLSIDGALRLLSTPKDEPDDTTGTTKMTAAEARELTDKINEFPLKGGRLAIKAARARHKLLLELVTKGATREEIAKELDADPFEVAALLSDNTPAYLDSLEDDESELRTIGVVDYLAYWAGVAEVRNNRTYQDEGFKTWSEYCDAKFTDYTDASKTAREQTDAIIDVSEELAAALDLRFVPSRFKSAVTSSIALKAGADVLQPVLGDGWPGADQCAVLTVVEHGVPGAALVEIHGTDHEPNPEGEHYYHVRVIQSNNDDSGLETCTKRAMLRPFLSSWLTLLFPTLDWSGVELLGLMETAQWINREDA